MSLADNIFIDMCKDVIETEPAQKVRRYVLCGRMELRLIPSRDLVL